MGLGDRGFTLQTTDCVTDLVHVWLHHDLPILTHLHTHLLTVSVYVSLYMFSPVGFHSARSLCDV